MTQEPTPYFPSIKPGDKGSATTFGRTLEEFDVGQVFVHGPGRTISEGEHRLFCSLTWNHHPLHSDENYASKSRFKKPVVVGNYVFEIIFGMTVADISGKAIANLEITSLKFKAPSFEGDTLYASTEVLEVRPSESKPDQGVVRVRTTGKNQRGEIVCEFERAVLIPRTVST